MVERRAPALARRTPRVPIHRDARRAARESGRSPLDHALSDGEDHELVATLPARALARVLAESRRRAPRLAAVGRVVAGRGLVLVSADGARRRWRAGEGVGGWTHGA